MGGPFNGVENWDEVVAVALHSNNRTSIDKKRVICYFDICSTAKMVKLR